MAVTHVDYTGNGSKVDYPITFPFLETSDVKVSVSGVTKTVVNDYTVSGTTLTFTSTAIPPNTAPIRIYRNTNADTAKHTYQAGASVKEGDLNNNQKQVLYKLQEVNEATASGTGLALVAGDKNDITVNGANDWVIRTGAVESSMLASGAVVGAIGTGDITTIKIADDAITTDKLANSINTEIAANTAKTTNATHSGEVTGATALTIADNVVDEANLKVSNSPTNGQFLSAQSGNTGGLTWAAVSSPLLKFAHTSTSTEKDFSATTWEDSGLSISYTPASSSSILVLEARPIIRLRPDGHNYGTASIRFELDDAGSALDSMTYTIHSGSSHPNTYGYSFAQFNMPILFTHIYSNSNTNAKTFKLQCYENTNAILTINEAETNIGNSTAKSYFTITEYST